MAGMLFKVDPFFKGNDNYDQLIKITKVMGTDELQAYLKRYKLSLPSPVAKIIKSCAPVNLEDFINKGNKHVVNEPGLDLLRKMLVYDKNKRITPIEAMSHPYFEPII